MEAPAKIQHPDDITKEKDSSFTPETDSEAAPTFKVEGDVSGDVFGDEESAEVKYKTMAWWQAGMGRLRDTMVPSPSFADFGSHDCREHLAGDSLASGRHGQDWSWSGSHRFAVPLRHYHLLWLPLLRFQDEVSLCKSWRCFLAEPWLT